MAEARFWRCKPGDGHFALCSKGKRLYMASSQWRETLRYYLSIYEEIYYDGTVSERSIYRSGRRTFDRHRRRDLNIARSIVNAARSRAEQSTRVSFLTDGGSWRLQRQAEKREHFVSGEFRRMKWPALRKMMTLHAGIFGTGIGKVFRDKDRAACALVHPWNFFVCDADGSHGNPMGVYERALVDRYVLAARHPKHARAIMDAPSARLDGTQTPYDDNPDRVEVWEGIRLPSGAGTGDGRHVIAVAGATLLDEVWERETSPYLKLYFTEPAVGFWGYGICELLGTIQETISRAEKQIEAAHHIHGHARLWAKKGTVTALRISNEPGTFNEYAGDVPPSLLAGNILSPEIYKDRQEQIQLAYTMTGVSGTQAQNIKPAGIDSGKALRMFNEISDQPLLPFLKACEQLDVDAAGLLLSVAEEVYQDTGSYESKAVRREGVEAVDYADLGDADDFEIEAFPVSALSKTPGGRLADVSELIESGLAAALGWEPAELLDLLDFPDLRAQGDLIKAPLMVLRKTIELILDGEEVDPPVEGINTALAKKLCVLYLQKADLMVDIDPESKDRLRSWYAQVIDLEAAEKKAAASQAAALAPTPGPVPPGLAAAPSPDQMAQMAAMARGAPGGAPTLDMPAPGALIDGTPQGPVGIA
jgi:hypothetical protein